MWRGWKCARGAPRARKCRLPQSGVPPGRRQPEVFIGARRGHAAARRAIEKSSLNEKRLVDVFDGVFFLVDGGRDAVDPHRSTTEFVDDGAQQLAIDLIEAVVVHFEQLEGGTGDLTGDRPVSTDLRVIADTPQQPVRNARGATRAP